MNLNFQGLLQSTCSVLGFEVGEIWFARNQPGTKKVLLRFHQLHISSIYEEDRRALIQPNGFEAYSDESDHKASPFMCRRAFENGKIVWANAKVCEGLVGRDVPLHTAVGIPVCTIGDDLCVIVLFSVGVVQMTPRAIQYLCATKAALPYYDKLTNIYGSNSNNTLILQEYNPTQDLQKLDTIPSVPSWVNLAFQDMNELVTCSDGSVNGLHSSWSYLRLSNLWNPTNENGTTIVDGKLSYTELKERFHELMIGLLHLTNFEITELWLVEDTQDEQNNNNNNNNNIGNNNQNNQNNNPSVIGKLSVVAAFHTEASLQPWAAFTRLITLTIGLDFPGQVVQSGRPITDNYYGQHHIYDPLYPRALHAKELGLKCAFGVPLPKGLGVCGTLVFYSRHDIRIHPKLITMITASAYLLAGSWPSNNHVLRPNSSDFIEHVPSSDFVDILQNDNYLNGNLTNGISNNMNGIGNINMNGNGNGINNNFNGNINDNDGDISRNYEIESKTLIDFAFHNALEILTDNFENWTDQGIIPSLTETFDNATLSDPLSTFPDAGRKRSRTTRSPRGSFGQLSDIFEDERCRRCYRQKDKYGQFCYNCEQFLSVQSNNIPQPISNISNQLIHQPIQNTLEQKIPLSLTSSSSSSLPRSASSLFSIPPSASAFMPQYCMPTSFFNDFQQQQNIGQFNTPHRRPSAEIALAMNNDGFYMGETNIAYPFVKMYSEQFPDLNLLDSNNDIFQPNNNSNILMSHPGTIKTENINNNLHNLHHNNNINNNNNNNVQNINNNINNNLNLNPNMVNSGIKLCKYRGCKNTTVQRSPYCASHAGSRKCQQEGCTKCAQGSTKLCIAHGGGRRCTYPGCTKGARDKFFCAGHGGGKRCETEGCSKSAVGSSKFCTNHGGGKRCKEPGCQKSAQSSTPYCVRHGGGRKCCIPGCTKVSRGKTNYCASHGGGGVKCRITGCNSTVYGNLRVCQAHIDLQGGDSIPSNLITGASSLNSSNHENNPINELRENDDDDDDDNNDDNDETWDSMGINNDQIV